MVKKSVEKYKKSVDKKGGFLGKSRGKNVEQYVKSVD